MSEAGKAVFLSYASQDTEAARRICDSLRAAGVAVWFDQSELVGGDQWDQKIRGQVKACALFVPIISATTQARLEGYFRLEWKLAAQRTHTMADAKPFLVPVVIDATRDAEAHVPEEFRAVQWTRLPQGEPTTVFVARVKALLGGLSGTGILPVSGNHGQHARATPKVGRRVPAAAWVVAIFVFAGVGGLVWRQSKSEPAPNAVAGTRPPTAEKSAPTINPKSIAILPFDNTSEDQAANAFFADGMHEDILTNLGVVRELHVTSRTSVLEYRGTQKKIRQIGAELGVAYVLEGSVRRAGNTVRVTGQLINARTDAHVWAKSYDRDLTATGVFAIQSELALEIAAALSAALSPQEKLLLENRPTTNLAAYDLFLKARTNMAGYSTELSRAQCEQLLLEAVTLDPAFAEGWAYLSWAHADAINSEEDHSPERAAKARAAIDNAVRIAPGDPAVIEMQGNYYYYGRRDFARAAEHYQRLLIVRPNSADAHAQLAFLQRRQGRWTESVVRLRQALQIDPRHARAALGLFGSLWAMRRYDELETVARPWFEQHPEDRVRASLVYQIPFFARGSTREMNEWLAQQKPEAADDTTLLYIRREWARVHGDWTQAVQLDRQHGYLEPFDGPRWNHDVNAVVDLVGHNELGAARARAKQLIPKLTAMVEKQPANTGLWIGLAFLYAFDGNKDAALRCARKPVELVPESSDSSAGLAYSVTLAQIHAWTGDKDRALAELARLLKLPTTDINVHKERHEVGWLPLRGDPRFEALLNDPQNNAPLF